MPRPDIAPSAPRFRLWIRRQPHADGPYSLRFTVDDGKGILRVSRPGVLIDPPARPSWEEERLSSAQLRSSRFLLVWDGGRARQAHLLTRLAEGQLVRLEEDRWTELAVVMEAGFRHLVLPALPGVTDVAHAGTSDGGGPSGTANPAFPFSAASLTHAATRSAFSVSSAAMAVFEPEDTEEERRIASVPPRRLALPDPEDELFSADMDEVTEEEPPRSRRSLLPMDDEGVFGIDDDLAFSVDTPSNRLETMHVMRGSVEAVTFLPGADGAGNADEDELFAADEAEDGMIAAGEADDDLIAAGEADEDMIAADEAEEGMGDGEVFSSPEAAEDAEADLRAAAEAQTIEGPSPVPLPSPEAVEATTHVAEPSDPVTDPGLAVRAPDAPSRGPTAGDGALDAPTDPSAGGRKRKKKSDSQVIAAEPLSEDAILPVTEPDAVSPLVDGTLDPVFFTPGDADGDELPQDASGLEPGEGSEPSLSRPSPLIRHLRRQVNEAQARMQAMELRIAELEAALAAARQDD